jgi:hypothetical protein
MNGKNPKNPFSSLLSHVNRDDIKSPFETPIPFYQEANEKSTLPYPAPPNPINKKKPRVIRQDASGQRENSRIQEALSVALKIFSIPTSFS